MKNFRHYVSVEFSLRDNEPLHYHIFDANDYQSLVSLNAFFYGQKQRNRNYERLFVVYRNYSDGVVTEWARYLMLNNKIPSLITHHSSIWDFYKAIGYDHKKNRWIRYD